MIFIDYQCFAVDIFLIKDEEFNLAPCIKLFIKEQREKACEI